MKLGKNIEFRFSANLQFVFVLILCVVVGLWPVVIFIATSIIVGIAGVWLQIKFHLDEKWRHAPSFKYDKKTGKFFPVVVAEGVKSRRRKNLAIFEDILCGNPDEAILNAKAIADTMNQNFSGKTMAKS